MNSHAVFAESQPLFFNIKLFLFFVVCEGKRSNNNSKYLLTAERQCMMDVSKNSAYREQQVRSSNVLKTNHLYILLSVTLTRL